MGPAVEETLRRAMSAIQSQRPDEALRLTQDILNKNPSQPNALHLYGYALLMQERADEASRRWKKHSGHFAIPRSRRNSQLPCEKPAVPTTHSAGLPVQSNESRHFRPPFTNTVICSIRSIEPTKRSL